MKKVSKKGISFNPDKLCIERQNHGLTLSALAKKINLQTATLSNWERGSFQPSAKSIYKLAKALKVKPEFFLVKNH